MATWRVAPSYWDLVEGRGMLIEHTPMDYLVSQGYISIYHEVIPEEGVKRWILYRIYDGAEVAVEKRWGRMGRGGFDPFDE